MTHTRCQGAMIEGTREEVTAAVPAGGNGGRNQGGGCGGLRSGLIPGSC